MDNKESTKIDHIEYKLTNKNIIINSCPNDKVCTFIYKILIYKYKTIKSIIYVIGKMQYIYCIM